ncbi:glycine--tRNA ligase subunit beta [Campylobacter pinnipediorum subsp. pinnipediorum]|uniref:Glycine--tRNA ligase beta subunit n=1 Tax=Campylobacter pinnipediorum subsp. pinnipediorum TaxID=1660067 RepID=A0AAX0LAI8_9BACT|nr:glycine--tRNA ligase subunit beta [Campylobacter pinnipediorum]AQW84353.1 glycyl-tRNA synthetase, beta chain [Campylobacter pinnipediorum subsp. pinnipediorum]OPA77162.1 glycine--tRNA ligase subunit beta [Campylobacter pinnipediorum subsp. pinnipediorum]OPA78948.1 glycine--tRNA ligase subunit beta [Campylobacter pinnipediorum subsp. pinnipediorum]
MNKELLIEIGVEELPAIPFLKELPNIKTKWQKVLDEYNLKSEFDFFYTPRRLVLSHKNFKQKQDDSNVEFIGAPKHIAIKDGKFTPAAISFAKKCEIQESELSFKNINGKEVLYHQKQVSGKDVKKILPDMIEKFLLSLSFGKSMRWGNGEFEFIRPIRSFLVFLGNEPLEFTKFGIKSENSTYPHRDISYDKIKIENINQYFENSTQRGVILSQDERERIIRKQFEALEKENNINIEVDEDLLSEVVAITEYPTALLGQFESEFLDIPKEVIITSMKENQRYFPVFKNSKLENKFIVVSNSLNEEKSLIIKGNEKVLRARLSDAMFFWKSDLQAPFTPDKLKNITYLKELGTLYDKELREEKIAKILAEKYKNRLTKEVGNDYIEKISRAVMLSKADLTSSMVYEFTELQGIMGHYYAEKKGEDKDIVIAIKEQYLPDGENADYPSTLFSSIVALSYKLDSLVGLFSVGKIPTGTKDPYALRRAANGVIKIILNEGLEFDISEILNEIAKNYNSFDVSTLENFILDRLYTFFDANSSIIKSCIDSKNRDIVKLYNAIQALHIISNEPSFKDNFSTFKRLSNIIKDAKIQDVKEELFESQYEKNLNNKFKALNGNEEKYEERLRELFGLKQEIDEFFENVMINTDDEKIKNNRIALIGQIYLAFKKIADIKEISF